MRRSPNRCPRPGATRQPQRPGTCCLPPAPPEPVELPDFEAVAALFEERREPRLYSHLVRDTHLVSFEPGHIALRLDERAPRSLAADVGDRLSRWTGRPWTVSAVEEGGGATLAEQHEDVRRDLFERARQHPLAQQTLESSPTQRSPTYARSSRARRCPRHPRNRTTIDEEPRQHDEAGQEMQQKMAEMQEALAGYEVVGQAAAGMVEVRMNARANCWASGSIPA